MDLYNILYFVGGFFAAIIIFSLTTIIISLYSSISSSRNKLESEITELRRKNEMDMSSFRRQIESDVSTMKHKLDAKAC